MMTPDGARSFFPPRASQNFQEFKGCCKQHHAGNQGVILCQCWPLGHGPAHTLTHRHTHGHMATHTHRHTGTHTHTHTRAHARSGLIDETHRACLCVCVRHGNAVKERSTCVDGSDTTGRRCEATANGGGPAASRDRRQGVAWSRRARDLILQ